MERKAGRKRLCLRCHSKKEARSTTGKRHLKKIDQGQFSSFDSHKYLSFSVVFIVHLSHFHLQKSKSTWPECTKLDVIEIY